MNKKHLPLVYACSGCSQVAQLANRIAVALDRSQKAEMSCIAGIGGGIRPIIRKAQSGRKILSIDGCPLQCVLHSLATIGVVPDEHVLLSEFGFKKNIHDEYSGTVLLEITEKIEEEFLEKIRQSPDIPLQT